MCYRKENLVACGPSSTGKTFFLGALGQQAVEEGMRAAWVNFEDFGPPDRMVVDGLGLLPVVIVSTEDLC